MAPMAEDNSVLPDPKQDEDMNSKITSSPPNNWLLNIPDNERDTKLQTAIKFHAHKLVRLLSLHGADPRIKNKSGYNAIHSVCLSGDTEMLRALMDPPNPNNDSAYYYGKPWTYSTAIMASCLEERNFQGETPLHMAVILDNVEIAKMLLQYGSNMNARSHACALTPLHSAVHNDSPKMVKLLLTYHADVNVRTLCTMSIYDAARHANPTIRKMLFDAGAMPTPKEYSDDDSDVDGVVCSSKDFHDRISDLEMRTMFHEHQKQTVYNEIHCYSAFLELLWVKPHNSPHGIHRYVENTAYDGDLRETSDNNFGSENLIHINSNHIVDGNVADADVANAFIGTILVVAP